MRNCVIYMVLFISLNTIAFGQTEPVIDTTKVEDCIVWMPNTFTPNSDSNYECVQMEYNCPLDSFELYIFNRWGESIFESKSLEKCWYGEYNGVSLPDGVYFWVLNLYTTKGKLEYRGKISLLR
jgi:gliding motility-associated-like protein